MPVSHLPLEKEIIEQFKSLQVDSLDPKIVQKCNVFKKEEIVVL